LTATLAAAVLVAVWIVATSAPAQATPVLLNGSFEQGTYVNGGAGFATLNAPSAAITNWAVTAGSVDWIKTYWTAQDGNFSLDLSGNGPGTITATSILNTTVGQEYEVDFWISGNPDNTRGVKTLQVTVGAPAQSQVFTFDTRIGNTRTNMMWSLKSFDFVATSSTTSLSFMSETNTAYGAALDNVSVKEVAGGGGVAVPEPVTMCGLLLGIGGLVRYTRKRRTAR